MIKTAIACSTGNYGGLRKMPPRYIVVHYTSGKGDTAAQNGEYFAREGNQGASAHWFVDETQAVASVPEQFSAWHCGGAAYVHPECRNSNSIGVELCSDYSAERGYYFTDKTIDNAVELVRELMERYEIPIENVVRHYDVTGKLCPAPFVGANKGEWERFKEAIKMYQQRYKTAADVPEWARETVDILMDKGILQGDGTGIDLSHDMVRVLVMLDRAQMFD